MVHNSPTSPQYSPTSPQYSPTSPQYSPTSPGYNPLSPVYSPYTPIWSPASPGDKLSAAMKFTGSKKYRPSSPGYGSAAVIDAGSRPPARFFSRLGDMFESGRGSDLTIVCGSHRFTVHKAILYPLSEVFATMFDGRFKESGQKEVELPDDDPKALEDLLRYMYTFKYEWSSNNGNFLLHHLRVAALADKYDVQELDHLARDEFDFQARNDENAVLLAEAVRAVYEELELNQFKNLVLYVVLTGGRIEKYKQYKDKYESFWEVVKTVHAFAVDLVAGEPTTGTKRTAEEDIDERAGKARK